MHEGEFLIEGAAYKAVGDGVAILNSIRDYMTNYVVPFEVSTPDGKKYKIIGFDRDVHITKKFTKVISFDESFEIAIPTSFFFDERITYILHKSIKRLIMKDGHYSRSLNMIIDKENKFISKIGKKMLLNLHPLELFVVSLKDSRNKNVTIRETTKIIGSRAYNNSFIRSVVIPASVEAIGFKAFHFCLNLVSVTFRGKSSLKIIGRMAFANTFITNIILPASVEEIERNAFQRCNYLSSFSISKDSKLKKIGDLCFYGSSLKYFYFPPSVEEIGAKAFCDCKKLANISFDDGSKLMKIGEEAFNGSIIEEIVFKSNVAEIHSCTFYKCNNLHLVSFPSGLKLCKDQIYPFNKV